MFLQKSIREKNLSHLLWPYSGSFEDLKNLCIIFGSFSQNLHKENDLPFMERINVIKLGLSIGYFDWKTIVRVFKPNRRGSYLLVEASKSVREEYSHNLFSDFRDEVAQFYIEPDKKYILKKYNFSVMLTNMVHIFVSKLCRRRVSAQVDKSFPWKSI